MSSTVKRTVFRGADVVLPDRIEKGTDVVVEDGKIREIAPGINVTGDHVEIDARGKYLLPGFIETHVHGGAGYDFMDGSEEAFRAVVRCHAKHGSTSIMPTTVACPLDEMLTFFALYRKMQSKIKEANLLGIHLEGPYISQAMRGAQSPLYVRSPSEKEIAVLLDEGDGIISRCTMAPEIPGVEYAAKEMRKKGIGLAIGHSDAISTDVFRAYEQGFDHITHFYCNTPSVRKINQIVYAGVREAAYLIDDMTVDLIGDGKHIPADLIKMVVKLKGTRRVTLITDAMRAAGTNVTESYLGKIAPENRVIVEDGVAKLPDRTYYAGSIATMDHVLRTMVLKYGLPLCDVSRMMSLSPAEKFGLDGRKGKIAPGFDADIILADEGLNLCGVYVGGVDIDTL